MESFWQGQTSTVEAMFCIKGHYCIRTCVCLSCRGGFASGRSCGLSAYVLESGVGVWVDRVSVTVRIAICIFKFATVEGSLVVVERKETCVHGGVSDVGSVVWTGGSVAAWKQPLGGVCSQNCL